MDSLAKYRALHLSPERIFEFFVANPRGAAFTGPPPGLGKTRQIRQSFSLLLNLYPRIHYAASQHRIINELAKDIRTLPFEIKTRRHSDLCGIERERQWQRLYGLNLSLLGRSTICKNCPNQRRCAWYSTKNDDCHRLVLQTQDRLFKNLDVIAASDFTILDELKFLDFGLQKRASRKSLEKFAKLLRDYDALADLLMATDSILTNGPHRPNIRHTNTASVDTERRRKELFSFQYKLLNAEIYNFLPLVEDQRNLEIYHNDSAIFYTDRPDIRGGLFVAGYGANQGLLEHYFGRPFADLTPISKYIHPGSRFYQLASSSTSHSKFMKNQRSRAGIYRFAAAKIAINQTNGKKTLLIAKSDATALILTELPNYLSIRTHVDPPESQKSASS